MTKRDQILSTLRTQPRMTAQQVGDALGITRAAALYHLNRLVEEGKARNLGKGSKGGYTAANTRLRGSETDAKILDRLARTTSPSMTAGEIAEDLGISTATAAKRLQMLKAEGKVLAEKNGVLRGYRLAEVDAWAEESGLTIPEAKDEYSSFSEHAEEFLKDREGISAETSETLNDLANTPTSS